MTIHQLKDRCWHLRPRPDDERDPHYDSWKDADEALRELREEAGPDPLDLAAIESVHAMQLDGPCWVVQCDGECEMVLDTEDEGYTYHHGSLDEAMGTVKAYEWRYVADKVFCEQDAPADAEPIRPSAAELEAAGQMRLPGVA